jgi:hypothetical protein
MTESSSAKSRFLAALRAIATQDNSDIKALEAELASTWLAYGSETEDNMSAVARVGVRSVPMFGDRIIVGPTLKEPAVLVSDVLNRAEEADIPEAVREGFPELSQADWQAVMRLATLILTAFESTTLAED